ncbi:unnamed protein product [Mytilus coruscus]|uniref:Uncharacterized protein n=1 Tax=Mytilus coruscus TaxID=42192 RepID=A0A6J7ZV94_MYTCO|nr:unnamed protein product [Mytilus coruscus]
MSKRKADEDNKSNLLQLLSKELVPSFDSLILVVGAFEAGKKALVANLIGNKIPRERPSTDGIDVYFGKLLFDLKTRKLLQNTKGVHRFPKVIYQKVLSYLSSIEVEVAFKESNVCSVKTQTDIPDDEVLQKLSESMDKYSDSNDLRNREVIPIPVLDFAGQIVYHVTHQTFITSHGIYLIIFNGSQNLDDLLSKRGGATILARFFT